MLLAQPTTTNSRPHKNRSTALYQLLLSKWMGNGPEAIPFLRSHTSSLLKKKNKVACDDAATVCMDNEEREEEEEERAQIMALASVLPPNCHKQEDYLAAFLRQHRLTRQDEDFVRRVFTATGIETGYSFLPADRLFSRMTREEYAAYTRPVLLELAVNAGRSVLSQFGGQPTDVTHLIFCTMTGNLETPSLDNIISKELGLRASVQRLNVENMGCQGGFRCLAMVQDIAQGRSRNVVLVVVCDLRNSMGNQMVFHDDYTPIDKSTVVSSSLFRDAGGAAIVAHPHYKQGLLLRQRQQQRQAAALGLPLPELPLPLGLEIVDSRMELIPNTEGLAVMKERNGGVLHLYLDKDLPHAAHRALPSVIKSLLADSSYPDLTPADCCYALHTGGPKVLREVASALGIEEEQIAASWHVMRRCGNMSGSSNLVVLDHVVREKRFQCGKKFCIGITFAPGLCVQTVLMRFTS